jgi:hypothetical protein
VTMLCTSSSGIFLIGASRRLRRFPRLGGLSFSNPF